ncbi:hypothetical protein T23_18260 [Turicibacter faecis]|uniref:XRE family transcriptional regulator n=1 Tax=Turicibacter faecis TaxID=2963365 RepID=A0ABN6ZD59_9FIRM|nr:hypothetical protein T23_18260 [Turicibacter sp. TC023]
MDFEQYLKKNQLTVKEFSQRYNLDYYGLNRVRNGAITRDRSIRKVFDELEIENERPKRVDTEMSFFTQESICIQHERKGDIYCYTECQLNEIEEYLNRHQIAYYVRKLDECWGVKYDWRA